MVTLWSPNSIIKSGQYVLCVLNQPVMSPSKLISLWNRAQYRVTVDGGTSVWTHIVNNTNETVDTEVPDLVTGDFDSADQDHVEHFKQFGAKIVNTPDQDYTDFTKCLQQISAEFPNNEKLSKIEAVFAFVESSGRLDQIMANIQTLFLAPDLLSKPVFLISSKTLSWVLAPGHHEISVSDSVSDHSHCGLIPLDGRAVVTTTGLKWNLAQGVLRFGELVSTSNGFNTNVDKVTVSTDTALLWTMDWN